MLSPSTRIFLYNSAVDGNWEITCEREVVGVPHDATGVDTKIEGLKRGDIVVVHDNTFDWSDFRVFGACVVDGDARIQRLEETPWEDLLWEDEKAKCRLIYPFRFPVQFRTAPAVTRRRFAWRELDSVPAVGVRGQSIHGKAAWAMKWRGNLLCDSAETTAMARVLGLTWGQTLTDAGDAEGRA